MLTLAPIDRDLATVNLFRWAMAGGRPYRVVVRDWESNWVGKVIIDIDMLMWYVSGRRGMLQREKRSLPTLALVRHGKQDSFPTCIIPTPFLGIAGAWLAPPPAFHFRIFPTHSQRARAPHKVIYGAPRGGVRWVLSCIVVHAAF
ncbi:hypothetical protein C8F04DRAFT_1271045 [Mycena alexandri]|uniref:Uncharacterized protein n=1 Tax=Mycena alexandri TaxID=1745969 RepID=A0AAD6S9Y9_9AGAR|nr:hypothetical protein C8F04DRAFT_1271045 [Mycena alexandri]